MCAIDEKFIPTLDFGHINSYTLGGLKTYDDYVNVFKTLEKYIGERYKKVHIHFSKIMYGSKGELKHLTFEEDTEYGPDFEILAKVLKDLDIDATIICERDSHKGMVIGKGGAMLKKIGELARRDIENFMGTKVYLQTWVKVKENWRDNKAQIRNFGYTE